MESLKSKAAIVAIAVALLNVAPLHAQQKDEPAALERLIDGVRGLFNRIFSGGEQRPAAEPEPPAAAPAQAGAVPPPAATAAPEAAPAAATPAVQAGARDLQEAVVRGDYDATLKLLDQQADIEAKDSRSGASPLHYAVMKGRMQIIDLLLSRGADVNSRTRNGTTPLHTAALYARKEVAERLLEKNADINALSAGGSTPLALATAAKNKSIVEMLRERGAK